MMSSSDLNWGIGCRGWGFSYLCSVFPGQYRKTIL